MLSNYTNKELIIIEPHVKNKEELFEKMVNHLYNLDYILNKKSFLQALKDRENVANTELMPGVALPHSRSDSVVKLFLSIVIINHGIDFDNPEMGKAKIVFFFGTSDKFNKEYLQLLAKSARLLKIDDFRSGLLKCHHPEEVMQLLDEYDKPDSEVVDSKASYLMSIILHKTENLDDLLTCLVELGITNASILDAGTLGSRITINMPLFSGMYFEADKKKHREAKIVLCQINDRSIVYRLFDLLKENNIDFQKRGTGYIQVIEAATMLGNPDEEIEL